MIPDPEARPPPQFDYLSVIGSLLHIVNFTRPDVAYAVGALARFSCNYDVSHVKAVKRESCSIFISYDSYLHYLFS